MRRSNMTRETQQYSFRVDVLLQDCEKSFEC